MGNLVGYIPNGPVSQIMRDIINRHHLDVQQPGTELAEEFFDQNLLPYAKEHWAYNGVNCNCQTLAETVVAAWVCFKSLTKRTDLPVASSEVCNGGARAIITKAAPTLGSVAKGNIRLQPDGHTDGRCYFDNHTVAKIGDEYFDLTYMRRTRSSPVWSTLEAFILYRVQTVLGEWLSFANTGVSRLMYIRDAMTPTPGFGSCYHELNSQGWIPHQEWMMKTGRGGMHVRSLDLKAVDDALRSMETRGWPGYQSLVTTFKRWVEKNPLEAKSRNQDNCVGNLAGFVGMAHWHP